jgi:hypothetical protein
VASASATAHARARPNAKKLTDLNPSALAASPARAAKAAKISCEDCYFRQNLLCALELDKPCPTFRAAAEGLTPPQQLSFVFRQERTRSAWVFAQPR